MFLIKFFTICLISNSLLLNFCSATPVPQFWSNSHPSCHEGYRFFNGMCTPIDCPATHVIQNNVCVLRKIDVAQPVQCSSPCCQQNCQPPCQQQCPVQLPMQMPMQMPVQMSMPPPIQIPIQMPIPIPIPVRIPVPFQVPNPVVPTFPPNLTMTTTEKCPNGTISINGTCHLVYCGIGIYKDGMCIRTECPEGTIWNGQQCKIPEAHNHTTVILSTVVITNNVNQSQVNHEINYTNNVEIDITESPSEVPSSPNIIVLPPPPPQVHIMPAPPPPPVRFTPPPPQPRPPPQIVYVPAPQPPPPPPPQVMYIPGPQISAPLPPPPQVPIMVMPPPQTVVAPNCCTITTPNTCMWEDRYVCRSHNYQQCGSVCSHGNLNLIPRVVRQPPESCLNTDCGYNHQPFYPDCSRCTTSEMMTGSYCQTYCQNSVCNSCKTFDLSRYCETYPEANACRPEYGYRENFNDDFYD